jgi:regulator of cell morphogenesis and NO signaling
MLSNAENRISDIVRIDYRTADVFKKHSINYCCGGQVSLQDACTMRNINYDTVAKELEEATRNVRLSNILSYKEWRIDFLVDYIFNVHHAYLHKTLPALKAHLNSFVNGHKQKYPEMVRVEQLFTDLCEHLTIHSLHEEEIIFPYIKQIDSAFRRRETYGNLFVRTLRKPLSNVEREHREIDEIFAEIRVRTNNYQFPATACTNYQVIYHKLQELDEDFLQHSYLEHEILFPRAIEIEQQLLQF